MSSVTSFQDAICFVCVEIRYNSFKRLFYSFIFKNIFISLSVCCCVIGCQNVYFSGCG